MYAKDRFSIKKIEPWDIAYYDEKLYKEKFNLSQEDLRPYFQETHVLKGMFDIVSRLYGIVIKERFGV